MRIPISFRLMAHTIKVRAVPTEKWQHEDCVGLYNADKQLIELRHQPGTQSEYIYTHELVHAILSAMGHSLNSDEGFVDNFSGLLHQAMTTARYPEPRQPRRHHVQHQQLHDLQLKLIHHREFVQLFHDLQLDLHPAALVQGSLYGGYVPRQAGVCRIQGQAGVRGVQR